MKILIIRTHLAITTITHTLALFPFSRCATWLIRCALLWFSLLANCLFLPITKALSIKRVLTRNSPLLFACHSGRRLSIVALLVFWSYLLSNENFWALSSVVALGANVICSKIPGLAPQQRLLCQKTPEAVIAIWQGAKLGLSECKWQFRAHRWNCSTSTLAGGGTVTTTSSRLSPSVTVGASDFRQYPNIRSSNNNNMHSGLVSTASPPPTSSTSFVFGPVFMIASREAAFMYAATSSGIMYAIIQACSKGNISNCGCDKSKETGFTREGWKWGGCSADIKYGMQMSRRFVDSREIEGDERSLMNLHNNRVGRKTLRVNADVDCKCHGVSGSCTMKTCWVTLPPFRRVGDVLKRKYERAKQVEPLKDRRTQRPIFLKLKHNGHGTRGIHKKPRKGHLVYLQRSPNYCERDGNQGSLGTVGRTCNKTSPGMDSCDVLCCGRGYNTFQTNRVWQCHCKFHWCCYVECNTCNQTREEYTCK